jgi:hypothetical protein
MHPYIFGRVCPAFSTTGNCPHFAQVRRSPSRAEKPEADVECRF